jgi:hypothetical protein
MLASFRVRRKVMLEATEETAAMVVEGFSVDEATGHGELMLAAVATAEEAEVEEDGDESVLSTGEEGLASCMGFRRSPPEGQEPEEDECVRRLTVRAV